MRRGAILLEMMLALALFVGAAGYTMMALQDGMASSDLVARHVRALDQASSTMAALEAGIDSVDPETEGEAEFQVEVERSPSQHAGLTRVEVRVLDPESEQELASLVCLLPTGGGG